MIKNKKVLGIGELVVDYIYKGTQSLDDAMLVHRSGGGTVWNILSNLSAMGDICYAAGVGGNDDDGYLAISDLKAMGVDCSNIKLLPHRQTRRIHHISPFNKLFVGDDDHRMGMSCPVCGHVPLMKNLAVLNKSRQITNEFEHFDIVFFDSLNKAKICLAKEFRRHGHFLIIDIGRIGHFRYRPVLDVIEDLRLFDIVVLPSKVLSFLGKRLFGSSMVLEEEQELIRILNVNAVIVTRGSYGARFYSWYKGRLTFFNIRAEEPKASVIDPSGAGDTFVAAFTHCLNKSQLNRLRNRQIQAEEFRVNLRFAARKAAEAVVILGARGHLSRTKKAVYSKKIERIKHLKISELQRMLNEVVTCPLCGVRIDLYSKRGQKRLVKGVASRNARLLRERLMFAANYPNINKFTAILNELSGIGYAIGTGGSFSVAHFVADALSLDSNRFVYPMRPFDFIRKGQVCDFLLVFSYSGSTSDCAKAINHAKEIKIPKIVLITGTKRPKLGSLLRDKWDKVLSYAEGARERGFVSIAGTVTPCALIAMSIANKKSVISWQEMLSKMYESAKDVEKFSNIIYEQIASNGFLDVFGGGLSWPAMLDLESKFIEAGLGRLTLHEVKDFSHGRFVTSLGHKQRAFLLFSSGAITEYEKLLINILENYGTVVHVHSEQKGILASLELLLKEQFLVVNIGKMLGLDISKPSIPRRALELYRWDK